MVQASTADCPHGLTMQHRDTIKPLNPLQEFQAAASEMGDTVHTGTVARVHQTNIFQRVAWESGVNWKKVLLAFRLHAMFGINQLLHVIIIPLLPLQSMVVAASCSRVASQQQPMEGLCR